MVIERLAFREGHPDCPALGLAYEHKRMLRDGGVCPCPGKVVFRYAVVAGAIFNQHFGGSLKTKRQVKRVIFAGQVAGDKRHSITIEKVGKLNALHSAVESDLCFWP